MTRSLDVGGAERQLAALARGLVALQHEVTVLTFYPGGYIENDIKGTDVRLVSLNKKGRWDVLGFCFRLVMALRKISPDILHSYLSTPNILAVMLKPFYRNIKVVWGILSSNMDLKKYDWLTGIAHRLERLLASFPEYIIVNSMAGRDVMLSKGYPENNMVAISNGIDTESFYVDNKAGVAVREELGVKADEILIGLAGRLDPKKDHSNFLKAAAILLGENKNLRFICVGGGPKKYTEEMMAVAGRLGLSDSVIWAGERNDILSFYNAFDIAVSSSSYGEGSANVVGEAMACGTPCVVTDVGDSAWIVGDAGIIVPPNNHEKLAEGILSMIEKIKADKALQSNRACGRVLSQFGCESMTKQTLEVFLKLI